MNINEEFNNTEELNTENNTKIIMFLDSDIFYDKEKNKKLNDF